MTPERLAEFEALCETATPGPWVVAEQDESPFGVAVWRSVDTDSGG